RHALPARCLIERQTFTTGGRQRRKRTLPGVLGARRKRTQIARSPNRGPVAALLGVGPEAALPGQFLSASVGVAACLRHSASSFLDRVDLGTGRWQPAIRS